MTEAHGSRPAQEPSVPTVQAEGAGVGWPRMRVNLARGKVYGDLAIRHWVNEGLTEGEHVLYALPSAPNATSTAGEVGEAVAWRYRSVAPIGHWLLTDHKPTNAALVDRPNIFEVQPLYARPQAALPDDTQPGISAPAEMDTNPDPKALRQMAEENAYALGALRAAKACLNGLGVFIGPRISMVETAIKLLEARSALPRNVGEG